jgi:hypothetical protein
MHTVGRRNGPAKAAVAAVEDAAALQLVEAKGGPGKALPCISRVIG